VLVLDAQAVVRYVNPQAATWCDVAAEALVGQPLAEAPLLPALAAALWPLPPEAAAPREVWLPTTQQWLSLRTAPAPAGQRWVFLENATASHQAEAARQRSSQLLLDMEAVAHTGSYEADLASGSFYFSDGMYRLFGEVPQAFVPTLALIDARSHPADVATVRQVLDEAVRTRQPYTYRRRIRRADGAWRTLEAHGEVRTDAAGRAVQLRGLVQDVTERVRAEEALHESRVLLRATIDSSLDMVQVFEAVRDEQGAVVDFAWVLNNTAAERQYGDVIGQRLCQLNPGVVDAGIFDTFRQVLKTGVPDQREHHYVHEQVDGWFYQSTVKLGDGVATTTQDITARKKAEQEVLRLKDELAQNVQDRYYSLFATMAEGVSILEMVYDERGQPVNMRWVEVNPAFERITGLTNVAGRLTSDFVPSEPYWLNAYDSVVKTGQSLRYENYHAGINQWHRTHTSRIGGPESHIVANVFEDITEDKRQEAQLRAAAKAQTFRLQLADALGSLTDPVAIQETVTRLARQHFAADRCYYCEIEGGQAIIRRDAAGEGLPSVVGTYPLADFTLLQAVMEAGRPFRVHDVRQDESVDDTLRQLCVQRQVISHLDVPVLKNGQPAGVLCLVQSTPREWSEAETALATEVAQRTWAAMERARAEQALAASEQRLRALITNLPGAAAFVVGPDLRYQLAGGEALDASGLHPTDLVGHTVAEAMPPALVPQHEAYYRQVLAGQGFALEHMAHGRTFISRGVPLPDAAGQPEAVLVVSYDITARKQAEEALLVSETKYRTLFETMDQGFGIGQVLPANEATGTPMDWQWLEVNPQFERLTGLPRTAVLSQTTRQLLPGLEEIWYERYAQAAAGETVNFESYSPVLERWFDVYAFGLGPAGSRRVAVLFSNTSEQKQVEAALREAEARYREQLEKQVAGRTRELRESRDLLHAIAEALTFSVCAFKAVRDERGRLVDLEYSFVNSAAERAAAGHSLVGQRYSAVPLGVESEDFLPSYRRVIETGEQDDRELTYHDKALTGWFRSTATKLGDGVLIIREDITPRKRAEQERLKNLRLLEQAEAVAGLGSWDYSLATNTMRLSDGMYHLANLPLGQPVSPEVYLQLVVDDDRPRAQQLVRQLTTGQSVEETLRLRVGEQVKTVRLKAVVLRDEAGQPARVLGVDLDISELQRLEADNLRLRLGQQQALFEAVQAAQEAERKRMAETLHNGVGQILYAAKLRLDRLHASALGPDPVLLAVRQEAGQLLSEAIRQTRTLSHELVSLVLEEFGLAAALQDISTQMSSPQLLLRSHVDLDEAAAPLTPSLQLALYRMAQELAQNVVKHAHGATLASLELETMPGWVLLRIQDNGPGFAANPVTKPGLGLRSIRDRVALLAGELALGSLPTGGAYVRIRIPLPPAP
jgi:PAS domain S-box-containing protein